MSWTDLFFPGNPGRRQEVVRLCTKLNTLLESNCRSTNSLIDIIRKYFPSCNIAKITLRYDADIKTNVGTIMDKVTEIQTYVKSKTEELKGKITPDQYATIVSSDTSFLDKIEVAKKLSTTAIGTVGSVAGVLVLGGIDKGRILVSMVSKLGAIRSGALSILSLGVLAMGIDMIASAIIGAVEKGKLEDAIGQLENTVNQFEPASYQFDRNIQRLEVYLEEVLQN